MNLSEMINFAESLAELKLNLDQVDGNKEYAIFGSASLVLRGILDREPGDIDVHFSRRVWGALLPNYPWFVETPKAGDPPILSNELCPIPLHGFYDWSDRFVTMNVPALIENAETVTAYGLDWRVIPVREALAHKKAALQYGSEHGVQKHIPDIALIEQWLLNEVNA